jgi:hypothetical protein
MFKTFEPLKGKKEPKQSNRPNQIPKDSRGRDFNLEDEPEEDSPFDMAPEML